MFHRGLTIVEHDLVLKRLWICKMFILFKLFRSSFLFFRFFRAIGRCPIIEIFWYCDGLVKFIEGKMFGFRATVSLTRDRDRCLFAPDNNWKVMWHKIFGSPVGFKVNLNRLRRFNDKARGVTVTTPYFKPVFRSAMWKENGRILKHIALAVS